MFAHIRQWVLPPTFEGEDDKTRTAALLNSILWIFISAASLYGILAPLEPEAQIRRAVIIVPTILGMLLLKQMLNWGYIRLTGILTVSLLWLTFTGAMFFGADYKNPAFMGYLIVIVCAGLTLNWRAAIGWSILSIATSAIILELGQRGILPPSIPTPPFAFWTAQALYILVCTFLLSQTLHKIDEAFANAKREIAERKRAEAERERVIKELETKNAELERFIYTVSHDLKSPLITIAGFIGLLETDARSGNIEKFKSDLKRIGEATEKMHRLLDELLELSRVGRIVNPPSEAPFSTIVEEALSLVKGHLMEKSIQIHVEPNLPVVVGDYPRLVEMMQNLIENAVKFMGDQPEPRIEIGAREQNGEIVFFVKDNGIGIEPQYHEKIFGLFDKLNPKSEGTGIGLAIVKRIIEVHGGRIWVESEGKGKGSTFCFTLPLPKR
ncbi:MAG TPA: ATP-binding protein [Anaerolineales bacterium]|nr:ATP-binding protein [Anaerolineales bacterium]